MHHEIVLTACLKCVGKQEKPSQPHVAGVPRERSPAAKTENRETKSTGLRTGRGLCTRLSCSAVGVAAAVVVVGHLKTCAAEAAFDVEALVGLAAIEDRLVTANLLGDEVEGLDDAQTKLLALLVLGDGDVLDVADNA